MTRVSTAVITSARWILGLCLCLSLASCGGGCPVVPQKATVRFAHVGRGAGAVDLVLDGKAVAGPVTFGEQSAYVSTDAGSRYFFAWKHQDSTKVADNLIFQNLNANAAYTCFLVELASLSTGYSMLLQADDPSPIPSGKAFLRYFILTSGYATGVRIRVDGTEGPSLGSFELGNSYTTQDPGARTITFESISGGGVILNRGVTLEAGHRYTLILTRDESVGATLIAQLFPDS